MEVESGDLRYSIYRWTVNCRAGALHVGKQAVGAGDGCAAFSRLLLLSPLTPEASSKVLGWLCQTLVPGTPMF